MTGVQTCALPISGFSNSTQQKTDKPVVKKKTNTDFDWDFGEHSQPKKRHQPPKPQKKSDDSFFDSTEEKKFLSKEKNSTKTINKITNDDFNF